MAKAKTKNCTIHFTQDDTLYDAKSVSGRPCFIMDFDPNSNKSMIGIAVKDKETALHIRDMFSSMVTWFDQEETKKAAVPNG